MSDTVSGTPETPESKGKEKIVDQGTMLDVLYGAVKGISGLGLSMFSDLKIEGKQNIPLRGKAKGIEVIGVYDIKEGKLKEFLIHQLKSMTAYEEVEGFTYSIEVRYKVTEALEVLGMKAPE